MKMKIVSSHGHEIASLEDWASLHKKIHWKKGRSAYSVADFILNRDGMAHLESRLSEVLRKEVSISRVTPEKEIRFDKYGRGRVHDLAIACEVNGRESLFVGLEAKVDENFGQLIQDELKSAEKRLAANQASKAVERIKALPARFSPALSLDSVFDIRYQLVHGAAGTVSAQGENREPFDAYVFYILVFKTSLYDEQAGKENHEDYIRFIRRVSGSELEYPEVETHRLTMDEKPLTCIYEHLEFPCYR